MTIKTNRPMLSATLEVSALPVWADDAVRLGASAAGYDFENICNVTVSSAGEHVRVLAAYDCVQNLPVVVIFSLF